MTSFPIPARTMFLIASVAVPRSRITKMVAFRILPNGQFRLEVYERVMSATCVANYHSLTVAGLRGPIVGSGDHKQLLHLHKHQGSIDNAPKEDASPVSVWSQSAEIVQPSVICTGSPLFPSSCCVSMTNWHGNVL